MKVPTKMHIYSKAVSILKPLIFVWTEAHDPEAFNSGSEMRFFFSSKTSFFGCNVTCVFSRERSFDLIVAHIWP